MIDGSTPRRTRHSGAGHRVRSGVKTATRLLAVAGTAVAVLGAIGAVTVVSSPPAGLQDRAITNAWHRAVDGEPGIVHVFERADAGLASLHATSTGEGAKPLVVGDRVTLLTPDGAILSLRVCDPASASATSAPDCLNAFVAGAVPPSATPVAQRSL